MRRLQWLSLACCVGSVLALLSASYLIINLLPVQDELTLDPSARIIEPQYTDGKGLPPKVTAIVEYKNLPVNHYLWIVMRVPKVKPDWIVYPQMQMGIPGSVIEPYRLEIPVGLGNDTDSGQPFNIIVLLLNEEANQLFIEYATACEIEKKCGGLLLPPRGVNILDFNTVLRE